MDPIAAFVLAGIGIGFPSGIACERWVFPWVAHQWAVRLRSHVRIR